jgi:hypothetical protein
MSEKAASNRSCMPGACLQQVSRAPALFIALTNPQGQLLPLGAGVRFWDHSLELFMKAALVVIAAVVVAYFAIGTASGGTQTLKNRHVAIEAAAQ